MDGKTVKKQNSFNELQVFIGQFLKQAAALFGKCGLIHFFCAY